MSAPDFKVGDRVISKRYPERKGSIVKVDKGRIHILRDDGVRGGGVGGAWAASPSTYLLVDTKVKPEQTKEEPPAADWSYGEADRLYTAARDAVQKYNEYIIAQPTVTYIECILPLAIGHNDVAL